jgi:hypothetical protein
MKTEHYFRQLDGQQNQCSKQEFEAALDLVLPRKSEKWTLIGCLPRTIDSPIIVGFKTKHEAETFFPSYYHAGYSVTQFSDITQEARERRGIVRKENYNGEPDVKPWPGW